MKIVLKESKAQEPFSFSFIGADGKTIVKSENYKAKKSAVNGIESVRKNCQEDARYEMKESSNGKFYFNVKASNGQVVGTSIMFGTDGDRGKAIAELKQDAPNAAVEEQSA